MTPTWWRMEGPPLALPFYRINTPHEEMGERLDIAKFNAPFAAAGSDR